MSYSGLIYAAIVACWAAVLVPRWIRRNEEVERAREEDAARGVRVLERRHVHGRHGPGLATLPASWSPTTTRAAGFTLNGTPVTNSSGVTAGDNDGAPDADQEPVAAHPGAAPEFDVPAFGSAARRRRRVLTLLVIALAVVCLAVAAGRVPPTAIAVAAGLLAGFLVLARRAAVAEARRRAHLRRVLAQRRAQAEARETAAAAASTSGRRVAVLDEPEPVEPADPNAWEPVPVPLPTYLTKAKAEAPVIRKIDLSSPGAWTSGRLNPASSIALPPPSPAEDDDLPEQWRAVGG